MAKEDEKKLILSREEIQNQYNVKGNTQGTSTLGIPVDKLLLGSLVAGAMMPQPAGKNVISNAADLFLKGVTASKKPASLIPPAEKTLSIKRAETSALREKNIYDAADNAQNVLGNIQKLNMLYDQIKALGGNIGSNPKLVKRFTDFGLSLGMKFDGDTTNIRDLMAYGDNVQQQLSMDGLKSFTGAISDRELLYSESAQLNLGMEEGTFNLKKIIDGNSARFKLDSSEALRIFTSGGASLDDTVTVGKSNITGKQENYDFNEFQKDYLFGKGYELVDKNGAKVTPTKENIGNLQISVLNNQDRDFLNFTLEAKGAKDFRSESSWIKHPTKDVYIYKYATDGKGVKDDKFTFLPRFINNDLLKKQIVITPERYNNLVGNQ